VSNVQLQCKQSCQKLVRYHATHTQSCFVVFHVMAGGHSLQMRSFRFAVLA